MPLDNTPDAFSPLFNDKTRKLEIEAHFALDDTEKAHIEANAFDLIGSVVSRDVTGEGGSWRARYRSALSRQVRQSNSAITKFVKELVNEIKSETQTGHLLRPVLDSAGGST